MSTQEQARALMMRHSHLIKNRQQSMLNRAAAEVGLEGTDDWNHTQNQERSSLRQPSNHNGGTLS